MSRVSPVWILLLSFILTVILPFSSTRPTERTHLFGDLRDYQGVQQHFYFRTGRGGDDVSASSGYIMGVSGYTGGVSGYHRAWWRNQSTG